MALQLVLTVQSTDRPRPPFSVAFLAYLSHEFYALTPAWLRSPYRSFPVDPPFMVLFSAKSLENECLRYVPSVARFLQILSLSRSLLMDRPFSG